MLLQVHQTELQLAVGAAPEEEVKDDELVGVRALFDMVGASKALGVGDVREKLDGAPPTSGARMDIVGAKGDVSHLYVPFDACR